MNLRYAILRHDGIPDRHFDLMFETAPGSRLATWRSSNWPVRPETPLTPLPDHRADYLMYEGPVSGNRGFVRRVKAGTHAIVEAGGNTLRVRLDDGTLLSFPRVPNLLADLPAAAGPAESFRTLLETPGVRIERIVSYGHASAPGFWYDGSRDEWVLLVAGAARLTFEGDAKSVELTPGAYLHIPAGRRHRVDWTDPAGPTVWLAVHFPAG